MAPDPRIPEPEGLNAEFYELAQAGVLHLQRCTECATFRHPPRHRCGECASDTWEWIPSRGQGVLYSWTVTHTPVDRGWAAEIPYVTGVIELEEGVRLAGAMLQPIALELGLPLQVELRPYDARFTMLVLRTP